MGLHPLLASDGEKTRGFDRGTAGRRDRSSSSELQGQLAFLAHLIQQYDRATEKARTPGANPLAQLAGAFSLAETGNYSEYIALLKANAMGAGDLGHLGYAYARSGNKAEAERIERGLQRRAKEEGAGAYDVVFISTALGRREEAFRWLDIASRQRDTGLPRAKTDRAWIR